MPDSITIMFFISVIVGIILIIISLVLNKETKKEEINFNLSEINKKQDELLKVIDEADNAIEQLNNISKNILEEQQDKYKELLYLYQIIDEKKEELSKIWEKTTSLELKNDTSEVLVNKINLDNPKYVEIIEMYNKGIEIKQIAKQLNLGVGEINLVLELNKREGVN